MRPTLVRSNGEHQEASARANVEGLTRLANALRDLRPLDAILDDIGDALDPQPPGRDEVEDIHQRLRSDLKRLTGIAMAARNEDHEVQALIQRARTLQTEALPESQSHRLTHLRQQGAVANDLLERLTATGTIKQVA